MKRFLPIFAMLIAISLAFAAKSKPAVTIKDMKFSPASISIKVDETVTWTNDDDRDHTVTATDASFDSDNIKPGSSYSHQFKTAGKFAYGCSYHPRMKGVVMVSDK